MQSDGSLAPLRRLLAIERRVASLCRRELAESSLFEGAETVEKLQRATRLAEGYLSDDMDARLLSAPGRAAVIDAVIDDLFFLGPIEPLLEDEDVSEIMVNAPEEVWVERHGELELTDVIFEDDDHVKFVIDRICEASGRRCDEGQPLCDCVLIRPGASFNGSRANCVCKGIAVDHHQLDIRKFSRGPVSMDALMEGGTFSQPMLEFMEALVVGRMNILITGGTGSGKTTLLNGLANFIPDGHRLVVIEDTPELKINKPNISRLQYRPANAEGGGEVTIRDLVKNALRMRPDRIIVGECRGAEAYDMLRAISSGHVGSLTTIHADSTRDAVISLRTMVQVAGFDMNSRDILDYVSRCFDFIISVERGMDGRRRVTEIAEVQGMEGDVVRVAPIMRFEQDPWAGGAITGRFVSTGERISERNEEKMRRYGVEVEDWWYRC